MDNNNETVVDETTATEVELPDVTDEPAVLPGVTATMEIAGVESIPNVEPDRIVLGFARN